MSVCLRLLSSLEKTMPGMDPAPLTHSISGLMNERISFQAAWKGSETEKFRLTTDSPIANCVRVRRVLDVPVGLAIYPDKGDDDYLTREPGSYPDLLRDMDDELLSSSPLKWQAVWVDVQPSADTQPGVYPVTLSLRTASGALLASVTQEIRLLPAMLPPQRLLHTRWFHADCLANYYQVEAFGEEHWRIVENFLRKAAEGGMNMTLMPVHTPPLDTQVGGERTTVQLVDVYLDNGRYRFGMDKVHRWIDICRRVGLTHFEIAHLYTQWGCAAAPKIMAAVDGVYKRIFGWDTLALSGAYRAFLQQYIPALRQVFREEGIEDRVIWHISDEPSAQQLEAYLAAKSQVLPLLDDCVIRDALSSFDFYRQGVVSHPIVATDHMEPFLAASAPHLWAYYCCAQTNKVCNQFIAMPSYRNRMIGLQLYKYRCEGFLHWGYNFYNNQFSRQPIDPYQITDADGAFPSGDPFQVYPGKDGQPEESIRMAVTAQAMQDIRALQLLESLTDRETVLRLMEENLDKPITFVDYPRSADYLLTLRENVNEAIMRLTP